MRQDTDQERRRVTNACLRCRKQKIKCSGTQPCKRCDNRKLECLFGADDKKVMIPESVLQELRSKINELEQQQLGQHIPTVPDSEGAQVLHAEPMANAEDAGSEDEQSFPQNVRDGPEAPHDVPRWNHAATNNLRSQDQPATPDLPNIANPLVAEQPTYLSISGRLRYLGHSSTWSFTQQVLQMARASPHANHLSRVLMHVEGEAYRLPSNQLFNFTQADISGLPPLNLSLYHLQSVKFRTCPLFHLFNEHEFTNSLYQFYRSPLEYARANPLWFIKYLVIMAFGKAFVTKSSPKGGVDATSAGNYLFMRAVQLLPNLSYLSTDPVESTEILCAIALYLQSLDHRCAAYCYIGQALRMAISHGLHKNIQANAVGDDLVQRCRRVWWTVYILDRKFSSSFGAPNSLRDEDITIPLPKPISSTDEDTTALMLYIRVCQLQGRVVSTLYSSQCELSKSFVKTTCSILKGAAGLSEELKLFMNSCFGEISRIAAHVNLAYHQCILVTSRPVLYHALKQRLESSTKPHSHPLSATMKGLIQVCIDSATQIVTILSQLKEHDLLDHFLPFDLETAASAGLALVMASNVHPKLSFTQEWFETLNDVLGSISEQGNLLASQRKAEIEDLFSMLNHSEMHWTVQRGATHMDEPNPSTLLVMDPPSFPSLGDPFFDDWHLDEALSGGQLMEVAAAMDVGSLSDLDLDSTSVLWS